MFTAPCACGRTTPRIAVDGRRDDLLRVRAVNVHPGAIGAVLARFEGIGRHAIVADGDPIEPPLRVYVEAAAADAPAPDAHAIAAELQRRLNAPFRVAALPPGALPVAEHETRIVYRTARGDELPAGIEPEPRRAAP